MHYFNEFDAGAAAWLRELMADGLIPKGDVDERSITEVPNRVGLLRGFGNAINPYTAAEFIRACRELTN